MNTLIITTPRSRARYALDLLLTALGWTLFAALVASGIANIFQGRLTGPHAPLLPRALTDALGTLAGYTVLMLAFALIIIAWFQYNEHFGKYAKHGRYRRVGTPVMSPGQLRQSLAVTAEQHQHAQTARVMAVQHDGQGAVVKVEAVEVARMQARASRI